MKHCIALQGVHKSFGAKAAVRDLSIEVQQGEIVGFVGPNGAGKSTSLRILVGLLRRDGGSADILGMDPARDGLAIRRRVTYLPGETSVYSQMTGAEYLRFARSFYPASHSLIGRYGELFELPMRQSIRKYSAGMKQRLALLAALDPDVEVYILDEPDRALDATVRLQLRDLLQDLRSAGKSVLLSSHHLSEVEALADRTVFLLDGVTLPESTVNEARSRLRGEIRLRLQDHASLPAELHSDDTKIENLPDGSLRIRPGGDPLQFLSRLPSDQVLSAEVGATRLEDIYRELTRLVTPAAEAGGATR